MEIGEFRKQFMEQLRFDAEHEGSAPEAQFISRALELLEDIGDVSVHRNEGAPGAHNVF